MEAVWFKSGLHGGCLTGELPVVVCLGRRDIADRFEQAVVVEPGYPFERGQFDRLLGFPWRPSADQLSFVKAVDGLGQRIVLAVALAVHGGFDAGFGQALAVADGRAN